MNYAANLKSEYYQAYANYIVKWLDAYLSEGLRMWGLSTGNEPTISWLGTLRINSMQWTPVTLAHWLVKYLGPSLAKSQHNDTHVLAVEDERFALPWFVEDMRAVDPLSMDYVSGIAVHWYADAFIVPEPLDQTHHKFPDKFIFLTESCMSKWFFFLSILGNCWSDHIGLISRLSKRLFRHAY